MSYSIKFVSESRKMRRHGYSLAQIATKLRISKSTASLWTSGENITTKGKRKIVIRQNLARKRAFRTLTIKRDLIRNEIFKISKDTIDHLKLDHYINKLICAILIWAEGEKGKFNKVGFSNSDPKMISTFLYLFRKSFAVDESKFRALVHIHEYHDKNKVMEFWSKTTQIPRSQFNRCYLKPHTGIRKRPDYMGSIHINYFDYKVARELASIYNMFADKYRGVG
jgi:hypothetical protein